MTGAADAGDRAQDGVEFRRAIPDQALAAEHGVTAQFSGPDRDQARAFTDPKGSVGENATFMVGDYIPERFESSFCQGEADQSWKFR